MSLNPHGQHIYFTHDIPKFRTKGFEQRLQTCPQQASFVINRYNKIIIFVYKSEQSMHKNRLIQLTQILGKSQRIGSRITMPSHQIQNQQQYTNVQKLIDKMIANNQQLAEMRNQYKKTANPQKQKQISHNLDKQTKEQLMGKIQKGIKEMNETQKTNFQKGEKSNTLKVTRLNQKASRAIMDFNENQQRFSNGVKDNVRRQVTIIQGNAVSEEQVEDIMANPQKGQQMLRAKLLDSPSVQLQNAVSDIIDKYNDIVLLQKSMHECLQMLQQLALLVALTGQQLDNIQNTIIQAQDFTTNAQKKLIQAKQSHKKSKKKICCIMMLLIALIGVVVIPIVITKV